MSVVSLNIPEQVGISVSESPVGIPIAGNPQCELDGRKAPTPKAGAVKMHRPNLGESPKQGLDVSGIKCLFKF